MIPIAADLGYVPPTIHDVDYYGKHSPAPGRTLWTVMRSEADETRHLNALDLVRIPRRRLSK